MTKRWPRGCWSHVIIGKSGLIVVLIVGPAKTFLLNTTKSTDDHVRSSGFKCSIATSEPLFQ